MLKDGGIIKGVFGQVKLLMDEQKDITSADIVDCQIDEEISKVIKHILTVNLITFFVLFVFFSLF